MKKVRYAGENLTINVSNYVNGNNIAVALMDEDGQLYGVMTVNLVDETLTNKYCAFLDTNNMPGVENLVEVNNLAKPTGKFGISGFCTYPEYEFDKELIDNSVKSDL